jgi:hypothetical protein
MSRQSTLRLLWAFSGATFIFGMTPRNMDAATSEPSPAQTSMSLQAGANMSVQSYGVTQISGAAQTSISGGMLILNKGGYPIVTVNSIKGGVGSPTVFAP